MEQEFRTTMDVKEEIGPVETTSMVGHFFVFRGIIYYLPGNLVIPLFTTGWNSVIYLRWLTAVFTAIML